MFKKLQIFVVLISVIVLVSCGQIKINPIDTAIYQIRETSGSNRTLLGLYNAEIIPDNNGSAEIIFTPLRISEAHFNVVGLMQAGSATGVGVKNIKTANGILDADITLTHPIGNPQFSGFDVRGILIGHGSLTGFSESLKYAGESDIRLLNADGHTRLWNPVEYLGKGYIDGKLGTPNSTAHFTATLNGYKYFCDSLTADSSVPDLDKNMRGVFSAGKSNTRHYTIKIGNKGMTFQYAVDANWYPPSQPVEVPGSFDVQRANAPEPYHIEAWVGPGITGEGGSANFTVDVYDWQKDVTSMKLEAPVLFNGVQTLSNPDDMGDFVRFSGTITNEKVLPDNFADILFYADGADPDTMKVYRCYHLYRMPLARVPTGGVIITIQEDKDFKVLGRSWNYISSNYDWGASNPAPVDYKDTNGVWNFTTIPSTGASIRKAIAKSDPEVSGFAGDFNSVVSHFWKSQWVFGSETAEIYQAEVHNLTSNQLKLWGLYEKEQFGAIKFDPPIDFPYPMNISTNYHIEKTTTLIPILLKMTIIIDRAAIGQGVAIVPFSPGVNGWGWTAQACLQTRTVMTISTGGTMGQGLLGKALIYEWTADDGTLYGTIVSGNAADSPPNFNESTFEITGSGGAESLISYE